MAYHIYSHEEIYKELKVKEYPKALLKQFDKIKSDSFIMSDWLEGKIKNNDIRLYDDFAGAPAGDYELDRSHAISSIEGREKKDATYGSMLQFYRLIEDHPELIEPIFKENKWWIFPMDQVRSGVGGWSYVSVCWGRGGRAKSYGYWDDYVDSDSALFALQGSTGTLDVEESVSRNLDLALGTEITLNGTVYVRKEDINQNPDLTAMRSELLSLANKITGYLKEKK